MGLDFFVSTPVAAGLNLVILVITIASLFGVARALRVIRKTEDDLDQMPGGDGVDRGALQQAARDLRKDGWVRQRIDLLSQFKKQGEPVDAEMLAAITAEEARDAAPLARWAASGLVLLGLAGTLIGLSLAIGGLSGLQASDGTFDSRRLAEAIIGILTPMKVAFSTTLAGVGGAVLVNSAVTWLRHRQSRVIRAFEERSTTDWVPCFQTTEESRVGEAVAELEATRKTLEGGLNAILGRVNSGFEELETDFKDRSQTLLGQVGELRDATLRIIGQRQEGSLSLADYVETVKATTDELQRAVQVSSEMLPKIEETLRKTIQAEQQALTEALAEHTRALGPVLERQEAAADALAKAVEDEVVRLEQMKHVLERLSKSFEAARATWERADQSIEKMGRETANALRDGLRESLEAVSRLTDEQAKSQERVTLALDGFQRTYKETLELITEQSRRARNQSQEMIEEVRSTLRDSLGQVGDRLVAAQQGQGTKIESGLNSLGRELRALAGPESSGTRRSIRTGHTAKQDKGQSSAPDDGNAAESAPTPEVPGDIPTEEIEEDLMGLE